MNGVIDCCSIGLEGIGKLLDLMLGLGQRHAIAWHNNHPFGLFEDGSKIRIFLVP
jgi:hypothetical protein